MTNRARNRLMRSHRDYMLAIVRRPAGWRPKAVDDAPPAGDIVQQDPVASYAEAHDDVVRCNQYALGQELDLWAVVLGPDANN